MTRRGSVTKHTIEIEYSWTDPDSSFSQCHLPLGEGVSE
jgi:hypothetical protein